MLLYHVTIKIDADAAVEWLEWMREKHIPEVMATGRFESYRLVKMYADETDGITYSIQYITKDMDAIEQYMRLEAPALQADHKNRYEGKFVAYCTLHDVIEG